MSDDFLEVAKVSDIPDPGKQIFEIDDHLVVLFHVGGEFFCLEDLCTHDGGSLGDGDFADHAIACPRHGAQFDIRNGDALTMPATEATPAHEVRIEGDKVLVRIRD